MIACFDMQHRLPTYDFFCWLAHVKLLGATQINISHGRKYFMRKKWPREETLTRFDNYIFPGPALAGLPCMIGEEGDRQIGSHLVQEFWADVQRLGGTFPKLKSVLPPGTVRYTVTIRDTNYRRERNSDPKLWREFAHLIGAHVFEDHRKKPIGLYERVSIMAGAEMNFGIPNGPLSLLYWTDYPLCEICDPEVNGMDFEKQGVAIGAQMPWFTTRQHLIWKRPTLPNILDTFESIIAAA